MPSLRRHTLKGATLLLRQAGCAKVRVQVRRDGKLLRHPAIVINQVPRAGAVARPGTKVVLTVR